MRSCVTVSLVPEARGGPFVYWDDLRGSCERAARLGFQAIEVFAPSAEVIIGSDLQTILRDNDVALAAVGTGAGWVKHRLHLALPDASRRREAVDFIRRMIESAAAFEAGVIIGSMQGRSGDGVDRATARGYLCDGLQKLGEFADELGVTVLFEPLNRYETDQVTSTADGISILSGLSCGSIKLLCDLFHMNIEETDVATAIESAGGLLGHVHFVDSNRRPVGLGHLDIRPVMSSLRRIGYSGYLSAEAFPYPDSNAAASQTMAAFAYWTSGQ